MKFTFFAMLITLVFPSSAVKSASVFTPVDEIFAVKGFDSNDNAEIIVKGWLQNRCLRIPKINAKVENRTIHLIVKATQFPAGNCDELPVPFLESVSLGHLSPGKYRIVVNEDSALFKESELFIAEANRESVDQYDYANVESIEKVRGSNFVLLKGYNPSDCLAFKEIKVISNQKNALAVLPILEKVRDHCPLKMTPFSYVLEVPKLLKKEEFLLHVRVMNGKSVNSLFSYTR